MKKSEYITARTLMNIREQARKARDERFEKDLKKPDVYLDKGTWRHNTDIGI